MRSRSEWIMPIGLIILWLAACDAAPVTLPIQLTPVVQTALAKITTEN